MDIDTDDESILESNTAHFANDDLQETESIEDNSSLIFPRPPISKIDHYNELIKNHNQSIDELYQRLKSFHDGINQCIQFNDFSNIKSLIDNDLSFVNPTLKIKLYDQSSSKQSGKSLIKLTGLPEVDISDDDQLFKLMKDSLCDSSIFPVPYFQSIENKSSHIILSELKKYVSNMKNTQCQTNFYSYYCGRNLHALKIQLKKEKSSISFHKFVKNEVNLSKSWINRLIVLYTTYKKYPKLMLIRFSVCDLIRLRKRILNVMKTQDAITWYRIIS